MPKGIVKSFDVETGFGFIERMNGGKEVFVHISAIESSGLNRLLKSEHVSFDTVPGREGFEAAINLKIIPKI